MNGATELDLPHHRDIETAGRLALRRVPIMPGLATVGSVRQLIHRVTRTIADWGIADGYFASPADGERFYRELTWLCLHQHGAFNSPVWFNVGLFHE